MVDVDVIIEKVEELINKLDIKNITGLIGGKKEGKEEKEEVKEEVTEEFRNGNDNDLFFIIAILLLMLCIYKNKK